MSDSINFITCSEDYSVKFFDLETTTNICVIDNNQFERAWCLTNKNNLFGIGYDLGFVIYELQVDNVCVDLHNNGRVLYKRKGDNKVYQGNIKPSLKDEKLLSGIKVDELVKVIGNLDSDC